MKLTGIPTISTRKTPINEYHINATEYNHSSTQLSLKKCILDLESDVYVDFMWLIFLYWKQVLGPYPLPSSVDAPMAVMLLPRTDENVVASLYSFVLLPWLLRISNSILRKSNCISFMMLLYKWQSSVVVGRLWVWVPCRVCPSSIHIVTVTLTRPPLRAPWKFSYLLYIDSLINMKASTYGEHLTGKKININDDGLTIQFAHGINPPKTKTPSTGPSVAPMIGKAICNILLEFKDNLYWWKSFVSYSCAESLLSTGAQKLSESDLLFHEIISTCMRVPPTYNRKKDIAKLNTPKRTAKKSKKID